MALTTLGLLKAAREDLNQHYVAGVLTDDMGNGCALGWLNYHLQGKHRGTNPCEATELLATHIEAAGLGIRLDVSRRSSIASASVVAKCNNQCGREVIVRMFDEVIAELEQTESPATTNLTNTVATEEPAPQECTLVPVP